MKKVLAAGAFALMSMAGSAQAAPTILFNGGSGMLPVGSTIIQDFESYAAGASIGPSAFAESSTSSMGARPAFGSTGNFASVLNTGSYTAPAFLATNVFSFVLGSLDAFNVLTLNFADGTSTMFTGDQIVGRTSLVDSGARSAADTNGVVSYSTGSGSLITGATFSSIGGSAFEFDNLAVGGVPAAVPEPAAWGLMILGFALVGGALRRRSSPKVKFAY